MPPTENPVNKVLLVDENEARLEPIRKALQETYEVAIAGSGPYALTMLEWNRPDVIVAAADLPGMDGFELCTIIRSDPKTKDLPYLLLAAKTSATGGAAARAGVSLVLGGDFSPADVVERVRRLVEGSRRP
jgi:CheY-like chemotaxis protein